MAKPKKIYWDSCAWLGLINGEPDKRRELEIVYGHAKKGHYQLWTSTLSIVESRRTAIERYEPKPLSDEQEQIIKDIFKQAFVFPIPLSLDIADTARSLWRNTPGLNKFQDAAHIASALRWNVPVMHTYDNDDLLHLNESFDCLDGTPLKICYPDETTDGALFAKKK